MSISYLVRLVDGYLDKYIDTQLRIERSIL